MITQESWSCLKTLVINRKNELESKHLVSLEKKLLRPREVDILLILTQLVSRQVNNEHISANSEFNILSTMPPIAYLLTIQAKSMERENHRKTKDMLLRSLGT